MAKTGTGTSLSLPPSARGPYLVYVNGDEQVEGRDFAPEAGGLRFSRPLRWARKTGRVGRTFLLTAGIGSYDRRDAIDVHCFDASGRPLLLTALQVDEEV